MKTNKAHFNADVLKIDDVETCVNQITKKLRHDIFIKLQRKGGVVGISGGIDSSVTLALAVKALGEDKVIGIKMPEKDSNPDSIRLADELAKKFGVTTITEDITAALAGFGCYRRRDEAVKRIFNPEFLNRIDDTIIFHRLERKHIFDIIDIQLKSITSRLSTLGLTLELTKSAKEFLVDKGYDPVYGARPLKRALQRYLEDPLAEEMLKSKFSDGSKIKVLLNKKKEELKFVEVTNKSDIPDTEEKEELEESSENINNN